MSNGTSYGMEFQFIFTKQGRQFSKPYWVELMEQYAKIESGQSTESEFGKNIHIISLLVKVVVSMLPNMNFPLKLSIL